MPVPRTATVEPAPVRPPRCAAASMPTASPETIRRRGALSPRYCLLDIGRVERFQREGCHVRSKLAAFAGEYRFGQAELPEQLAEGRSAEPGSERKLQPARESRVGRHAGGEPGERIARARL